jgi:PAS domain S-box-containing protein
MDAHGNPRREARDDLIEPEAILEAVIEMSDDAIFTCDSLGSLTRWSAAAERLFGRLTYQVLDGPLEVLFPTHLYREVQAVLAAVMAGDRIKHFETEIQRQDGMPLPVSLSLCRVLGPDKVPIGVVVIARDVTEQRLAQATLAELDARMEEGEALAHIGSWLWDLRTGVVQWSSEFHRIHGIDPLNFGGTFESYLELIHRSDRDHVRAGMLESVRTGRPFEGEYRVVLPDGLTHTVLFRAQPILGSAETVVGLRGLGQDVSDQGTSGLSLDPPDS